MPTINKLPIGGGGASSEVGISDGKGIVNLNIFTQMDEPTKKDGIWIKTNHKYNKVIINDKFINYESGTWQDLGDMDKVGGYHNLQNSACAMYNGKIHFIGGWTYNSNQYTHIVYDFQNYDQSMSDYNNSKRSPFRTRDGCAITCNDGIHFLGGYDANSGNNNLHYLWDDNSWTQLSSIPYDMGEYGGAVIYNNEIHVMGGGSDVIKQDHYKYNLNTKTWTKDTEITTIVWKMGTVVYNGEIHLLGGKSYSGNFNMHWAFNGTTWSAGTLLPVNVERLSAVVYNNEIHILGGINVLNETDKTLAKSHYKYNGSVWTQVSTLPYEFYEGCAIVVNDTIHLFGGNCLHHYGFKAINSNVYDPQTVILEKGTTNSGKYLTNISDTSVIEGDGSNNRFVSGFDDCYYFADSSFDWNAPMYYGDGSQWIKFKN